MLSPHDRVGIFEALRPPQGASVEAAVGTSFTLDLEALLTAPIAFALFEAADVDLDRDGMEPVGLLEAIRRHSQHVLVFSQAGQIAVPERHRTVFAWIEDSVIEVTSRRPGHLFHPKVWVVRYRHAEGSISMRLLCATRNLTFDTSWDTLLRLDGPAFPADAPSLGANPALADFVSALPSLATRPVPAHQVALVDGLAADLRRVRFVAPEPFQEVDLHVFGLGADPDVFPAERCRAAVISPFVSDDFLANFADRYDVEALVSREETLDRLSTNTLARMGRIAVLHPAADLGRELAEIRDGPAPDIEVQGAASIDAVPRFGGLHAKLFAFETGHGSRTVTGSANATAAAFAGNVEVVATLTGPRGAAVDALLAKSNGEIGLDDLLLDYVPLPSPVAADEYDRAMHRLESIRREVASATFTANVEDETDVFRIELSGNRTLPESAMDQELRFQLWPATLIEDQSAAPLTPGETPRAAFTVSFEGITAFFGLRITLVTPGITVSTTSLLVARLEGAPSDRHPRLLASMLRDQDRLLRYLLLLLSDVDAVGADTNTGAGEAWLSEWPGHGWTDIPLLELLVRAVDRFPERLDHIDGLLRDLTEHRDEVLPPGFQEIWQPIWKSRCEEAGR